MCLWTFKNAKGTSCSLPEKASRFPVMRQREILLGETTAEIVDQRMDRVLEVMKDAAFPHQDQVTIWGFGTDRREEVKPALRISQHGKKPVPECSRRGSLRCQRRTNASMGLSLPLLP